MARTFPRDRERTARHLHAHPVTAPAPSVQRGHRGACAAAAGERPPGATFMHAQLHEMLVRDLHETRIRALREARMHRDTWTEAIDAIRCDVVDFQHRVSTPHRGRRDFDALAIDLER